RTDILDGNDDFIDMVFDQEFRRNFFGAVNVYPINFLANFSFFVINITENAGTASFIVAQGFVSNDPRISGSINHCPTGITYARHIIIIKVFIQDSEENQNDGIEHKMHDNQWDFDSKLGVWASFI